MSAASSRLTGISTQDWLELLYRRESSWPPGDGGHLVLWTRQDRRSHWFSALNKERAASAAIELARRYDVYCGVGLHPRQLGSDERGRADGVCSLPGLWLDLDVAGPAHQGDDLPPDREAALSILDEFPLPPTALVESGHGLQGWWLFHELWRFNGAEARPRAADLSQRFQATLCGIGRRHGWHVDATHDLARVLRVPGTYNRKLQPVPVEVIHLDDDRRYAPEDFEPYLVPVETVRAPAPAVGEEIPQRERATTLTSLAGSMRRRGMSQDAITAALLAENEAKCRPPLCASEVRAIAASVARYNPADRVDPVNGSVNSPVTNVVTPAWPTLDRAALYGLPGEVVATLDPHTEADPAAVLVSFLVAFGAAVGAGPHAVADGAEHPARLFAVLVGATSRGRKGTAQANVRRVMAEADPVFTAERILGGLASGEGLIQAVRDADDDDELESVDDKRLLVYEPEFARVLKVCSRESSTLSALLRDAWDRGDLRVMTRRDPLRASGAHIALLAHVTVEELRRSLLESDAANGYGNRHLFVASRRSKRLPAGGNLDYSEIHALGMRVRTALERGRQVGILRRSPEADGLWNEIYMAIDDEADGMVGALTARAEAQMLRLSVVYALTDGSPVIHVDHLAAAQALWAYSEATVTHVYGDSVGDEVADRLLAAIRQAGEDGLDREAQRDVFARNVPAARVARAREVLERKGLVVTAAEHSGGRPRQVTRTTQKTHETQKGSVT